MMAELLLAGIGIGRYPGVGEDAPAVSVFVLGAPGAGPGMTPGTAGRGGPVDEWWQDELAIGSPFTVFAWAGGAGGPGVDRGWTDEAAG